MRLMKGKEVDDGFSTLNYWIMSLTNVVNDLKNVITGNIPLQSLLQIFNVIEKINRKIARLSLKKSRKNKKGGKDSQKIQMTTLKSMFQLHINKEVKTTRDGRKITSVVNFQCLSPYYTFSNLQELKPRSIILTSGTLAPLETFESELGVKFDIKLENSHVISKKFWFRS